ncbi:MAG: TRAP transporter substrate-binding protein [Clostridiales Family XIII bacterium]|jgi:tripartite ATP-independent transporter DctP family solute receptor|nr:TRAP transporter substrate-binding protein [Clostridiales Family XIII bacterium]
MKKIIVFALIATMIFTLAACGGKDKGSAAAGSSAAAGGSSAAAEEPAADGEVFNIIYSGTIPDETVVMQQVHKAADLMYERSNGRLNMTIYPNNQLTDSKGAIQGMQDGTIQVGEMSTAPIAGFTDKFQPACLPFFFMSAQECIDFMKSDFYNETLADEVAAEIGVRPVGGWYNGPRSISNGKRAVVTPADCKGLKIRVMESPIYIKTWEALGAQPTPMSLTEVFTALQQGTIDAQDNAPALTVQMKFYEVQHYFTDLSYIHDVAPLMVSEQFYQSLPEDLREIFVDSFKEVMDEQYELGVAEVEDHLKTMEDYGCEVTRLTDDQRAAFKDAVQPVYDWFKTEYPDLDLDAYEAAF